MSFCTVPSHEESNLQARRLLQGEPLSQRANTLCCCCSLLLLPSPNPSMAGNIVALITHFMYIKCFHLDLSYLSLLPLPLRPLKFSMVFRQVMLAVEGEAPFTCIMTTLCDPIVTHVALRCRGCCCPCVRLVTATCARLSL